VLFAKFLLIAVVLVVIAVGVYLRIKRWRDRR